MEKTRPSTKISAMPRPQLIISLKLQNIGAT